MRLFLLLLLAASASASAQKPGNGGDPASAAWRLSSLGVCTADLEGGAVDPDDARLVCDCALDRVAADHSPSDLPPIDAVHFATTLGGPLMSCAAAHQPRLASAIAERLTRTPPAVDGSAPTSIAGDAGGKPVTDTAPAPARASAPDFQAWWNGLDTSGWLGGVPLWAWLAVALLAFFVFRLVFGRDKERGRDLIGPPPNMRPRGAPPRPRR